MKSGIGPANRSTSGTAGMALGWALAGAAARAPAAAGCAGASSTSGSASATAAGPLVSSLGPINAQTNMAANPTRAATASIKFLESLDATPYLRLTYRVAGGA